MTPSRGYALITGASSGIGEEFARRLAERGWSMVLVARSGDKLEELRNEMMTAHPGLDIRWVALDLAVPGAAEELFQRTQAENLEITLLINNAGAGAFGEFTQIEWERQRRMLDLNILALVELTHLYLTHMYRQTAAQRRTGGVIQIGSMAGFIPFPYCAVYGATKAFVVSFSHAVHEEARRHGVHVMVVNPGSTSTNFFVAAGGKSPGAGRRMQTAAQVVDESLRAFDRGRRSVTTGASNRLALMAVAMTPRSWIAKALGSIMGKAAKSGARTSA
jgi:short-subunit dehydrogenase